jgi:hypothetical protein
MKTFRRQGGSAALLDTKRRSSRLPIEQIARATKPRLKVFTPGVLALRAKRARSAKR